MSLPDPPRRQQHVPPTHPLVPPAPTEPVPVAPVVRRRRIPRLRRATSRSTRPSDPALAPVVPAGRVWWPSEMATVAVGIAALLLGGLVGYAQIDSNNPSTVTTVGACSPRRTPWSRRLPARRPTTVATPTTVTATQRNDRRRRQHQHRRRLRQRLFRRAKTVTTSEGRDLTQDRQQRPPRGGGGGGGRPRPSPQRAHDHGSPLQDRDHARRHQVRHRRGHAHHHRHRDDHRHRHDHADDLPRPHRAARRPRPAQRARRRPSAAPTLRTWARSRVASPPVAAALDVPRLQPTISVHDHQQRERTTHITGRRQFTERDERSDGNRGLQHLHQRHRSRAAVPGRSRSPEAKTAAFQRTSSRSQVPRSRNPATSSPRICRKPWSRVAKSEPRWLLAREPQSRCRSVVSLCPLAGAASLSRRRPGVVCRSTSSSPQTRGVARKAFERRRISHVALLWFMKAEPQLAKDNHR